jgi:hypothetical protein
VATSTAPTPAKPSPAAASPSLNARRCGRAPAGAVSAHAF